MTLYIVYREIIHLGVIVILHSNIWMTLRYPDIFVGVIVILHSNIWMTFRYPDIFVGVIVILHSNIWMTLQYPDIFVGVIVILHSNIWMTLPELSKSLSCLSDNRSGRCGQCVRPMKHLPDLHFFTTSTELHIYWLNP
jgi:hypothetical protein